MFRFLLGSLVCFCLSSASLASQVTSPQKLPFKKLLAAHGVSWGAIFNYDGNHTVQAILHRGFASDAGQQVLAELGFRTGVVATNEMFVLLEESVRADPSLIDSHYPDEKGFLRRLKIATKVEQFISDTSLDENMINTDETLNDGQKAMLRGKLRLAQASRSMSQTAIDRAMNAVQNYDLQTLIGMIDSGEIDPNMPVAGGNMNLLGLATKLLALDEVVLLKAEAGSPDVKSDSAAIDGYVDNIRKLRDLIKALVNHPRVDVNAPLDRRELNFIEYADRVGSLLAFKIAAIDKGMNFTPKMPSAFIEAKGQDLYKNWSRLQ